MRSPDGAVRLHWRTTFGSGALLAGGAAAIGLLERLDPLGGRRDLELVLIAGLFLALGTVAGLRLMRRADPAPTRAPTIADPARFGITPREAEVLEAIAEGLATKEIARRLGISPNTVKTHSARLYEKLGAARRTEAIARARAARLLP